MHTQTHIQVYIYIYIYIYIERERENKKQWKNCRFTGDTVKDKYTFDKKYICIQFLFSKFLSIYSIIFFLVSLACLIKLQLVITYTFRTSVLTPGVINCFPLLESTVCVKSINVCCPLALPPHYHPPIRLSHFQNKEIEYLWH